ncbi:MAG: DUF6398 domain-containing protein, partial [Chloroflexota bacterium]
GVCRKLAAALARKRPSPLERGRVSTWAAGILYAAGRVNFVFDKSKEPHLSAEELASLFGVAKTTAYNKSSEVWDLLHLMPLHPNYCLPSMVDDNLMIWMLSVNGLIVDIRRESRELQEIAFQKGLIPYVPADHQAKD